MTIEQESANQQLAAKYASLAGAQFYVHYVATTGPVAEYDQPRGNYSGSWDDLVAWLGNEARQGNGSTPFLVAVFVLSPKGLVDVTPLALQKLAQQFITPTLPVPGQ